MENNWKEKLQEALLLVPDGIKMTEVTSIVSEALRNKPCKCLNCNSALAITQNRSNQTRILRQDPTLALLKAHLLNNTINKYTKGRDIAESILCEKCWVEFGVGKVYDALEEINAAKKNSRDAHRSKMEQIEFEKELARVEAFCSGQLDAVDSFWLLYTAYGASMRTYNLPDTYHSIYEKVLRNAQYDLIARQTTMPNDEYYKMKWYKVINAALQGHNNCQVCGSAHEYFNQVNLYHTDTDWHGKEFFLFDNSAIGSRGNNLNVDLSKTYVIPIRGGHPVLTNTGVVFRCGNCVNT